MPNSLNQKSELFDWAGHSHFLSKERMRPIYDRAFGQCLKNMGQGFAPDPDLKEKFLQEFDRWLHGGTLNKISGLTAFPHRDFITGVTHYLDDLHITFGSALVCLEKEYAYHRRMKADFPHKNLDSLKSGDVLVLGAPFAWHGDLHPQTNEILERCLKLNIPVHIDAAWFGCMRDFQFHYDHPAIQSVAFSLSKGLGLGSHRAGVRYARSRHPGPITITNDFGMETLSTMSCGLIFMREFGSDYAQNRYQDAYKMICDRYHLKPSKAIHTAFAEVSPGDWEPRGVRAFLRYFVDDLNEFK